MKALTPNERIIAWRLATGKRQSIPDLIAALWHPDNEPKWPEKQLSTHLYALKQKIPFKIQGGGKFFGITRARMGYYIAENDLEEFRDWLADEIMEVDFTVNKGGRRYVAIVPQSIEETC